MRPLPAIMVAPNGARRRRRDVPGLPETVPQIVHCVADCVAAGADGFHLHVRDEDGQHVLDAGLYGELLAELGARHPGLYVQVTTEAVGRYAPAEQRALVAVLRPEFVSIAVRELFRDAGDEAVNLRLLRECAEQGMAVQHILYDDGDTEVLARLLGHTGPLQVLQVIGTYRDDAVAGDAIAALEARIETQRRLLGEVDWAVACFGVDETPCLSAALDMGGKARIGFENSLRNADGGLATDNAERVRDLLAFRRARPPAA